MNALLQGIRNQLPPVPCLLTPLLWLLCLLSPVSCLLSHAAVGTQPPGSGGGLSALPDYAVTNNQSSAISLLGTVNLADFSTSLGPTSASTNLVGGLTEEASIAAGDFFLFEDRSAGLLRKGQIGNIPFGSASTQMVSAAIGFLVTTNPVSQINTNMGTNAAVTFDLMGPAIGHYGISGNSTISLTNVVLFTNNAGARYVELMVRQFGVAGTLTISPIGPHAIDWDGGLFIAQNATNRLRIFWNGLQFRGEVSHADTTGSGAYARSNAPAIFTPNLLVSSTLTPAAGSATVTKAAPGSTLVTNIVGLLETNSAAVLSLNFNSAHEVSITNGITAATTLVGSNGWAGQKMSFVMLGEAAGGTDRVVTIVPHLGDLVANENSFGAAVATTYSETLTNGNFMEGNIMIRRMNGTNTWFLATRQGKR